MAGGTEHTLVKDNKLRGSVHGGLNVCVCVCYLPLGAPHGRMGPVHSSLCNTTKQKIHLSLRTPAHMRRYIGMQTCAYLQKTGVEKTQKQTKVLVCQVNQIRNVSRPGRGKIYVV